jgi:hypothetical protein
MEMVLHSITLCLVSSNKATNSSRGASRNFGIIRSATSLAERICGLSSPLSLDKRRPNSNAARTRAAFAVPTPETCLNSSTLASAIPRNVRHFAIISSAMSKLELCLVPVFRTMANNSRQVNDCTPLANSLSLGRSSWGIRLIPIVVAKCEPSVLPHGHSAWQLGTCLSDKK